MTQPRLLVFASGSKDGGGSGARTLLEFARVGMLDVEIVLVSHHANGGVRKIADQYQVPFHWMSGPFNREEYQRIVDAYQPDVIVLSGWIKLFAYFPPGIPIVTIHPALLPGFGGQGMYGHHVHEGHIDAFRAGTCAYSAVCMHFVDEHYDHGAVIFRLLIAILPGDTPETLAERVNKFEHVWQWWVLMLVATRQ